MIFPDVMTIIAFGHGVRYLVIRLHFKMSSENKAWLFGLYRVL